MLRIVIAEDAALFRAGLVRLLEDRGHQVCAEVADGEALLGAVARCEMLCARALPAQREAIQGGLARLVDPAAMGERWKAMALTAPGLAPLAGFGAAEPAR